MPNQTLADRHITLDALRGPRHNVAPGQMVLAFRRAAETFEPVAMNAALGVGAWTAVMVVLMVGYTMTSLWIIAQPIVATR